MNHVNITRRFIFATTAVFALAACHRQPSVAVVPAPLAPDETVRQFLAAVNAANLDQMAQLWGTERGPAAVTSNEPPDKLHQRLEIIQHVLQADSFRVRSIDPVPGHASQRLLQVDLMRGARRATVPFTLVPARTGGWLVTDFGINQAMPLSQPGSSD